MHISNTITHKGIEFYPVSRDGGDIEQISLEVSEGKSMKPDNTE